MPIRFCPGGHCCYTMKAIILISLLFPYLQNPKPTQMTVMWPSTEEQQTGWVEYGQDSLDCVARESRNGLFAAFSDINRVTMTGLDAGTTYRYRVAAANIVGEVRNTSLTYGDTIYSDVYEFTTPQAQPSHLQCLFFDDIHSRDTLMGALLRVNDIDPLQQDFIFFNGDITNAIPSREGLLRHLIEPYSSLFASRVPFMYARGNHELRNKYARELERYVTTPGTEDGHPYYYTFTWGPCFFIVLDAGEDKEDANKEYKGLVDCESYRETQAAWLETQLKSKACRQAKFRVVVMHVPFETSSVWDFSMKEIDRLFLPLCNKYKVDLAIHGHCHHAALLPANKDHHFPIVIGGGKEVSAEKKVQSPAVISLQADKKRLQVDVWDYFKTHCVSLTLTK